MFAACHPLGGVNDGGVGDAAARIKAREDTRSTNTLLLEDVTAGPRRSAPSPLPYQLRYCRLTNISTRVCGSNSTPRESGPAYQRGVVSSHHTYMYLPPAKSNITAARTLCTQCRLQSNHTKHSYISLRRLTCLHAPGDDWAFNLTTRFRHSSLISTCNSPERRSVWTLSRLDLSPALGPVIEFCYWCPLNTIAALISQIESVREALPERNPKRG